MILHAYVDVYVLCVCIVGLGYTTQTIKQETHLKNKHLGRPLCQILGTISKVNERGTLTNGPDKVKTNNDM